MTRAALIGNPLRAGQLLAHLPRHQHGPRDRRFPGCLGTNNHGLIRITLSDALLSSLGPQSDDNTTSTATSRWADINAGGVTGNVLVVAASASDTTPDDEFKISQLDLKCQ